jgi:hypothetical protein
MPAWGLGATRGKAGPSKETVGDTTALGICASRGGVISCAREKEQADKKNEAIKTARI